MENLWKTYDDITGILRKRKIRGSDVIRETVCQRLLLVEYSELKITDNQSDNFLRILSKNVNFPKKILGSLISLTYKRLMKILRRT